MTTTRIPRWLEFCCRRLGPAVLAAALLGAAGPAAFAIEFPHQDAKEALALMLDNQNRCYRLAVNYQLQISRYAGEKFGPEKALEAFALQSDRELEQAKTMLRTIEVLVARAEGISEETKASLETMFDAQSELYELLTQYTGWESPDEFDAAVDRTRSDFNIARSQVAEELHLSTREHRQISERYERGSSSSSSSRRTGSRRSSRSSSSTRSSAPDPLVREKSAAQYEKEKEEYEDWLAEQERLRYEKVRKLREQQEAAIEQEKVAQPAAPPPPMPKVGVRIPTELMPPSEEKVAAMEAWHRYYSSKVYPVKMAIGQYLQVQKSGTSLMVQRSCKKMSESLATVLADEQVFHSPEPTVATALETAMKEFKLGADQCLIQPYSEQAKIHIGAAEKALATAASELKEYRLAP